MFLDLDRLGKQQWSKEETDLTDNGIYRYLTTLMHTHVLINIPSVESHDERQNITYSLLNHTKEDERFTC